MKQFVAIALAALVCVLYTGATFAGEKGKEASMQEMEAQMKAYQEAAAPGPHHEAFKSRVGEYTAAITMWQAPGTEPAVSKGKSTYTLALGGRFLTQNYEGEFMGMPFVGMGVSGFDTVKGKHTVYWIDTMGTQALYCEGDCTDKCMKETYVFSMTDPVTKGENKVKMVTTIKSKDQHVMEWYGIGPDGKESKTMEIVYTRVGS
jgi:hypothetical protein